MAVANTWATGQTSVSLVPQLRPSSSSSSINFTKNPFLRPPQKNLKRLYCCCTNTNNNNNYYTNNNKNNKNNNNDADNKENINSCIDSAAAEWDWNRWTHHFSEIEQADHHASLLKFQLEEAIEKEDFHEAAKLKTAIAEAMSKDSVGEIMSQLQSAINDERYRDASRLFRSAGIGLVGWWVGYSKDSDDPFGRVIRITRDMGRFVGRSYSPRQLVTASPGIPLFEIFVIKDTDDSYTMQVVYLRQTKGSNTSSSSSDSKPTKGQSAAENENELEKGDEKSINIEGATEEGSKCLITYLRNNIPDMKVKAMNIELNEEVTEDRDPLKQLLKELEDSDPLNQLSDDNEGNTMSSENSEEEDSDLDEVADETVSDAVEDEYDQDVKLFIARLLNDKEDNPTKDDYIRVPAKVKDMERDSFVLHVPKSSQDYDSKVNIATIVEVSETAAQSFPGLMPPDVAKAFLNPDKISPKVPRDVREIIKLAVKQAQNRSTLSEYTNFSRITTSKSDLDPFEGLFVGTFGPYGTEVVQLRRKYGNWNFKNGDESICPEFFEYVEAVKLTGDLNVPAGQVTFRAKIGRGRRSTNRGMFPAELGVVSSYKGHGKIAEFGYRNPQWVEGELLQLNGKGMGPYLKGPDLGFLYVTPERNFLVLFSRLILPE